MIFVQRFLLLKTLNLKNMLKNVKKFSPTIMYVKTFFLLFTALHGMQRGLNDEISVRLSVRLSVCLSNACIVTKRKKDMF